MSVYGKFTLKQCYYKFADNKNASELCTAAIDKFFSLSALSCNCGNWVGPVTERIGFNVQLST